MSLKDLDKLRKVAIGGGLVIKSTDLISDVGSPTALTGNISGMVGIGIAGATSKMSMDLITGKHKRRKKKCHICKKRKTMKGWSICKQCKGEYGKKKRR